MLTPPNSIFPPVAHQKGPDVPLESLPTVCCGSETGYMVTCWQPGRHLGLKSNGINLLLSVCWAVKGGGYLILPEQTRNVQGRVQTMDFCSHLNSFAWNLLPPMTYKAQRAARFLVFLLLILPTARGFLWVVPANEGLTVGYVWGGGWGVSGIINFLSLVGSHLIPGAHSGERTLGSHFVYGSK